MFSSGPNYNKLKTNLRLAQNRLKLLEKKKSELTQKARKEIADYLINDKTERAKIRVEHIIREDYLVEAMEIIEMYCDLLLARFGLIQQMTELDDGIAEPVSSLVWVSPRLLNDVPELKVISDIFVHKYGGQFAEKTRTATGDHHVSEKLMHKLQLQAPPKLLVEKYLIEIAKNYNVEYTPDPQIMKSEKDEQQQYLIDLSDKNNLGGEGKPAPQIGFIGYPAIPPLPEPPVHKPFNYPPPGGNSGGSGSGSGGGGGGASSFTFNIPPCGPTSNVDNEKKDLNTNFINKESNNYPPTTNETLYPSGSPDENVFRLKMHDDPPPRYTSIDPYNLQDSNKPKPQPRSKILPPPNVSPSAPPTTDISLPNVPNDLPDIPGAGNEDDIDFDDLSRRFENLKKRK